MKNYLSISMVLLGLSSQALANEYKVLIMKNDGKTQMSLTIYQQANGAIGQVQILRYRKDGSAQVLSSRQIVGGDLSIPITQPDEPQHLVGANLRLQGGGTIEFAKVSETECQVSTKKVSAFKATMTTLGCSIFDEGSVPGGFTGSN